MTDTPVDPKDVWIKPSPAMGRARVTATVTVVTRVQAVVEKLASEGASSQEIVEAIRQESPEIAEVVEANAAKVPQGWTLYQWVVVLLMLISVAIQAHVAARPHAEPPSMEEIVQIIEDTLSKVPAAPSPGEEDEEPKGIGGGQAKPR